MGAGKILLFVGIVGAVGVGAWWYLKKRKKSKIATGAASGTQTNNTAAVPGTGTGTGIGATPTTTTTPTTGIAPGEPIPKMSTGTTSGLSPAQQICNVPQEILSIRDTMTRLGKIGAWEIGVATPAWEAQGRGMDLLTYIRQLKEEGGCITRSAIYDLKVV